MNNFLYKKMFLSTYFFTIAISKKENSIIDNAVFEADYVFPANPQNWCADPILVEQNGKTFLFYEAVCNNKGRIEVVQIYDDCSVSKPTILLDDDCHYSYPFIFELDGQWYMIPESSATGEIRLYRAIEFPYKWEQQEVLLNEKAVDTTLIEVNGKNVLLTYLPKEGTERVTPCAYEINFVEKDVELRKIQWNNYDELKCRGAGPAIISKGKCYRPAQISKEDSYGDQVAFYQIDSVETEYLEHLYSVLDPSKVRIDNYWYNGLHTYSETSKFVVIDVRCRKFDLLKIPKTLYTHLLRK